MNNDLNEKRLKVLKGHIKNDLDLLKKYEDKLRDETEPRTLARYHREIERQHESLAQYQHEYYELEKQVLPAQIQNVTNLLQQQYTKPDDIQRLLPPIWNVPYHRNLNFTGRDKILSNLRRSLISKEPDAWKQAVTGMGGVGKTQLVVAYIYLHKTDYRVIWWIRSEESAAIAADYADLAVDLDLPDKDSPDQTEITKAVKHWLEHNSGWLLIFDNAHDPGEIRNYLPKGGAGHLIITSRIRDWRGVARLLPVEIFDRAESIDFLCKRTGQDDRKAADALADELGDLPLALEQTGAYIETTGIMLTDYQELFQSRRKELWDDETHPPDYSDSVPTTWSLAMEQVSRESPEAADLLNLCAFLAPDGIYLKMFSKGAEHLPELLAATATDMLAMNRAIRVLNQYSLINTSSETLSVHRLVQAVVRDRLSEDDEKRWAETAVTLLSAAFPFKSGDVRTWPLCSLLLPHALAAVAYAEALDIASEETNYILNQVGTYLLGHAEFAEAKAHFERALLLAENIYGPDHPNVAIRVNNLGKVLQDLGELRTAKQHLERALKIDENTYGSDHPNVARDVNNLGTVLQDLGDLQAAKQYMERALKIDENTYGPDHPNVARDVNNLGTVLQDLGDLQAAKQYMERALKIDENTYGPSHPNVARDVNNLGKVLQDLGDLQAAKQHVERALKIGENTYGPDHPYVITTVNNLGKVLQDLGDLQGARQQFERALKIDENTYGPDHLNVAIHIDNFGTVLRDLGDLQGAKQQFERALEIFRKVRGEEHPSTVKVRNNLESLANIQGRVEPGSYQN